MTSKVYVLQATRHQADVSPAAVYGDIQFVLSAGDRTCSNPELSMERLRKALRDFDPLNDFIVWAGGDPLSAIVAGMVMLDLGITKFRYLRFEKNRNTKPGEPIRGFYSPVEVMLEEEKFND
jgi:hypothetical protein